MKKIFDGKGKKVILQFHFSLETNSGEKDEREQF